MAPVTQSMIGYDERTYSETFMRVSKHRMNLPGTDQGRGEINVQSCCTGSSVMSSKMLKSRHLRKFQTMISSSMRKIHYGPL